MAAVSGAGGGVPYLHRSSGFAVLPVACRPRVGPAGDLALSGWSLWASVPCLRSRVTVAFPGHP